MAVPPGGWAKQESAGYSRRKNEPAEDAGQHSRGKGWHTVGRRFQPATFYRCRLSKPGQQYLFSGDSGLNFSLRSALDVVVCSLASESRDLSITRAAEEMQGGRTTGERGFRIEPESVVVELQ